MERHVPDPAQGDCLLNGIEKLTRWRELALLDGDCSALYVDARTHSERILRSKDE